MILWGSKYNSFRTINRADIDFVGGRARAFSVFVRYVFGRNRRFLFGVIEMSFLDKAKKKAEEEARKAAEAAKKVSEKGAEGARKAGEKVKEAGEKGVEETKKAAHEVKEKTD
jgi:hypothetical protein